MEKKRQLAFLEDSNGIVKTKDKTGNLYVVSDDEIKEGDWYCHYNSRTKEYSIFKADDKFYDGNNPNIIDKRGFVYEYWNKKIIATTDSSLSVESKLPLSEGKTWVKLPQPSQSFIKEFVREYNKGNIITDVLVEYEEKSKFSDFPINSKHQELVYKLKVNSKDNTIIIKKVKDSFTRDEVVDLLKKYRNYFHEYPSAMTSIVRMDKWIEKNL